VIASAAVTKRALILIVFSSVLQAQTSRPEVFWSRLEADAATRVEPECPLDDDLAPGEQGNVMLRIVVGTDGKVKSITPSVGLKELSDAAAEALAKWQFKPQAINGKITEVQSMAMLDVCQPPPPRPVIIVSPLAQAAGLIRQCSESGSDDVCSQARAKVEEIQGHDGAIARGMLATAEGDRFLKSHDFAAAEAAWKKPLSLVRKEPDATGIRFDLLYRLGLLYDRDKRFEDSLAIYKEQEEVFDLMQKMMAESKIPHTDSEKAEAAEGAKVMLTDLLEGQLRALIALNQPAEAQKVREKLARLK